MKLAPPSPSRGFSLVEILTVVAIMSVLAFAAVSSVSSLKSTALTSSGNQMVDVFAMARQNSISKNDYTAVAIMSQGQFAYRAYCLLELAVQDDGTFGSWTPVTAWRYLPAGTVFEPVDGSANTANDTFFSDSPTLPSTFPALPATYSFQGQQINLGTSTVIQYYQPDGTLSTQPAGGLILRMVEGQINSGGAVVYQGASYYDLVFVSNTGIAKIRRP
jgi:prepilin-type N-terminal cleavage/methylation domain-containing protein